MFVDMREATTDDARAIARVGIEARRVGWKGIIADSYLRSLDSAEEETRVHEFLADPEADWGTHVALTAGGVAGYVTAGPTRGDDASPSTAHIAALFVAPEWFGQGVGTLLLADATDRLSKMGFSEGILLGS